MEPSGVLEGEQVIPYLEWIFEGRLRKKLIHILIPYTTLIRSQEVINIIYEVGPPCKTHHHMAIHPPNLICDYENLCTLLFLSFLITYFSTVVVITRFFRCGVMYIVNKPSVARSIHHLLYIIIIIFYPRLL